MEILSIIRIIIGIIFIISGLFVFLFELYGIFRMKYVMNRMHSAAMGDTMGLFLTLIGLMLLSGWNFTSLKFLLIIVFFWFSSPVSSHLLSKLVIRTDDKLEKNLTYKGELDILEKKIEKERKES